MADKKVNDMEMSAILEAFAESREGKAVLIDQSKPFKVLIVFCNIYVLTFLVIYYSLKNNFLDGFDEGLLNEDVFTVFDGRAHIMFWLLVSMNVGAYFNFGFKVSCVIALVYLLNNTVDIAVLFAGLISLDDRTYFSVFILSIPLFFVLLAWMGLAYKDKLEDD
ncbi:hypothetical protein N9792_01855 [Planktomarina temperata]|nr:hypothetical protein [Planktomarina temperata]MDC1193515.1 hypothetical protein [Planktomarina temperata]MDC1234058.1 hypothetical protein [Planktomarina temperata]